MLDKMDIIIYGFCYDLTKLPEDIVPQMSTDKDKEGHIKLSEYNKNLYSSAQDYLFEEGGLLENTFGDYVKLFKNGYLYIGFELDKNEMLDRGVVVNDYNFAELTPLIDNISTPRLFRFNKN